MAVAQNITFLANGYDLAPYLQYFTSEGAADRIDATVLANNYRSKEAGFHSANIAAEGKFDTDAVNADTLYDTQKIAFSGAGEQVITASFGTVAIGDVAMMMNAINTKFDVAVPQGLLILNNIMLESNNALNVGKWLVKAQRNAGSFNSASVDNAAQSTNGGLAHVHLHNDDALGAVVTLQHSTNDSTWVDLATAVFGTRAGGGYTFGVNPTATDTIVFNGVTFTFIAGASTTTDIQIKGTLALTMVEAAAVLNASVNASVSIATYTATATGITVSFDAPGVGGNAYTLGTPTAGNVTRTGATLTGGLDLVAGVHDKYSVTIAAGTTVRRYLRTVTVVSGGNTVLVSAAFARR